MSSRKYATHFKKIIIKFLRNILFALIMTITKKNTSYQSRLNLKPTVKCIHLDLDQIYNLSQNPKEKPL